MIRAILQPEAGTCRQRDSTKKFIGINQKMPFECRSARASAPHLLPLCLVSAASNCFLKIFEFELPKFKGLSVG
jgi:hypothetical protein